MVEYIPHKNRFLAFLGCGIWRCKRHDQDVGGEPFYTCWHCYREELRQKADLMAALKVREREERIEEMAEAIRRSGVCASSGSTSTTATSK